jgi:hypothetical protein
MSVSDTLLDCRNLTGRHNAVYEGVFYHADCNKNTLGAGEMPYQIVQLMWYGGVSVGNLYADVFETTAGVPLEITSGVYEPDHLNNPYPWATPVLYAAGTAASLAWEQGILASYVVDADATHVHPSFYQTTIGNPIATLPFALTPPTVSIGSTGGLTNQPTQLISGTVQETEAAIGTTVSLYDNNILLGTASVQGDGTWKTTVTLSGDGTHTIVAQDTDVAGDIGSSNSVVFTLDTTPVDPFHV